MVLSSLLVFVHRMAVKIEIKELQLQRVSIFQLLCVRIEKKEIDPCLKSNG